jgi:hypothetical protein
MVQNFGNMSRGTMANPLRPLVAFGDTVPYPTLPPSPESVTYYLNGPL